MKKIDAERKEMEENPARIVRLSGNFEIKNVRKVGDRVVINCSYNVSYIDEGGKEYAKLYIEGEVVSDEEVLLKEWEVQKRLSMTNTERIINFFLQDANLYLLLLAKWLGIPYPFSLPRVKVKAGES